MVRGIEFFSPSVQVKLKNPVLVKVDGDDTNDYDGESFACKAVSIDIQNKNIHN